MPCAKGSASEYLPAAMSALIRALSAARPFWATLGVANDAVIASAKPATSVKRRRVMNPLAACPETITDLGRSDRRQRSNGCASVHLHARFASKADQHLAQRRAISDPLR